MSESATEQDPPQDALETPDVVVDQQATEQQAETPDAPEPTQEQPQKPNRGDRRFANLTARTATLEAELAETRRRAEAAEALVRAKAGEDDPPPRQQTVDVDAIKAQVRFEDRRDQVVARGNEAFGDKVFEAHAGVLRGLGALENVAFMQALVELPNAEHLIAEFADDTDALTSILQKPPVAMAAEMGRMAAKLETKAAAPTKPLSAAPRPPTPVHAPAVTPEIDPYKIKTAQEWKAYREKTAPKRLGGRG